MKVRNVFQAIPEALADEHFETILRTETFRLERIVSKGHATPAGEWYDQTWSEWVLLLQGGAGLAIAGRPDLIILKPGDYFCLPARLKHRVEWTLKAPETIWLALHYE